MYELNEVLKREDMQKTTLLRPSLFWDVDLSELDMVQHSAFIIVRVIERGRREDVRYIWNYYGEEFIKKHLLEARSLNKKQFLILPIQYQSFTIQEF